MRTLIAAAATLMCLATPAHAGPTLSLGLGTTDFSQYENVDAAVAGKVTLGWHFEGLPLLIEASYLGSGKHDIHDDAVGRSLTYQGGDISVGGFVYRNSNLALDAYVKGGYYHGRTTLERVSQSDLSANSDGFSTGAGVLWQFSRWAALRLDVGALLDVRDLNGPAADDRSTLWSTTAGIILRVPSTQNARSSEVEAVPAAAPEIAASPVVAEPVAPAAPVSQPVIAAAPVVAPTPEAPVSAPRTVEASTLPVAEPRREQTVVAAARTPSLATRADLHEGDSVTLNRVTKLFNRPIVKASVDARTPKNAVAVLGRRVSNAYGTWWFVTVGEQSGWVPEEVLQ